MGIDPALLSDARARRAEPKHEPKHKPKHNGKPKHKPKHGGGIDPRVSGGRGGLARAAALSPGRRSEIARAAALVRWKRG